MTGPQEYPQGQPQGFGPPGPPPGYPPGYPPGHPAGPPPGYPPYPYQRPPKRRPSAWWFLPCGIALLLAVVCAVYAVVAVIRLFHTDGYLDPGAPSAVIELDDAGRHMLFKIDGTPDPACTVIENGPLALKPVFEDETVDLDSGSWVPFASFTSTGTEVQLSCTRESGAPVRVGAPAGEGEYVGLGISFIAAAGLGLAGLAGTIVVAVLFFSRPSRKVTG